MSGNATIVPQCPHPFLPMALFPDKGGAIDARICFLSCCLPCPSQDWIYPDNFQTFMRGATYMNCAGVLFMVLLLITYVVLPVEKTLRHYLSVCLVIAVLMMEIAFVIPMGMKSHMSQCIDAITAHDMYSSINCALSGAFVLGGGLCVVMWVFLRSLSLHLQICWHVVPGKKFFLTAQALGWTIPVIFLATCLSVSGVSYRFGDTCHINSKNGLQSYWGPLLALAAGAIVTQFVTFGYCVHVYLKSLFEDKSGSTTVDTNSQMPYPNSMRSVSARQAFRRIKRVLALQWRGILIVVIIIADCVFFSTVFLQFDGQTEQTPDNIAKATKWLTCLIKNDGDKNKCLDVASQMVVAEATAIAVIFLLSCNGFWVIFLLGRWSMITGWIEFFRDISKKKDNDHFVSAAAIRRSSDPRDYEMLHSRSMSRPQPERVDSSTPLSKEPFTPIILSRSNTFDSVSAKRVPSFSSNYQRDQWERKRTVDRQNTTEFPPVLERKDTAGSMGADPIMRSADVSPQERFQSQSASRGYPWDSRQTHAPGSLPNAPATVKLSDNNRF